MAVKRGFESALEAGAATRLPSTYIDADEMHESTIGEKKKKKKKNKVMKANNLAMAYLHMAVELGKATGFLAKECDYDYPNGQAYLARDFLQNKYTKTDMLSASKLIKELNNLRLKEKGDPVDFFEKIAVIQLQARKLKDDTISDNEIISKIVIAAPKMYMSSIIVLQKKKGSSLDIEDIKEEMCELYIICSINDDEDEDSDDDSEKEMELTNPEAFGQKFGGKCYICHQPGHKAH